METKIIETPFKKFKVEIKIYLTAKEVFEIQKILYDSAEIIGGTVSGIKGSKGEVMITMEKKLMETAVVGINGSKEKVLETLLEMSETDYDFVKAEIDKMRSPELLKKK